MLSNSQNCNETKNSCRRRWKTHKFEYFPFRVDLFHPKADSFVRLMQYLISNRKSDVIQSLDNAYRNTAQDNSLKVFCVSNTLYWENRESRVDALRFLELSGILEVRKHCISMVANSQLRLTMKYINDDIPALLGDIELWVQSGAGNVSAARRAAIRQTLNTVEARLQSVVAPPRGQLNYTK